MAKASISKPEVVHAERLFGEPDDFVRLATDVNGVETPVLKPDLSTDSGQFWAVLVDNCALSWG